MATYTSYLNLEKPAVGETFNLLKINQNWDKIDQGVSSLNSKMATKDVTGISVNTTYFSGTPVVKHAGNTIVVSATLNIVSNISGYTALSMVIGLPKCKSAVTTCGFVGANASAFDNIRIQISDNDTTIYVQPWSRTFEAGKTLNFEITYLTE